ncbi:MAG: WbqC family protein [Bacteroidota bacterium]
MEDAHVNQSDLGGYHLPLYCWPEVSWVAKLMHLKEVCFDPDAPFVKAGGMNRYRILDPGGSLLMSLPIAGGRSHHQSLGSTRLVSPPSWSTAHWKRLLNTYRRAPYFDYWSDDFENLILKPDAFLLDYNLRVLDYIMKKLKHPWAPQRMRIERSRLMTWNQKPLTLPYYQHFEDRLGFVSGLSIMDLLMQCGPNESKAYLQSLSKVA